MQFIQENQVSEMTARLGKAHQGQSPFKWHKNCEIAMPLDKPCSFCVAGKIINAKKGDIVFINSRSWVNTITTSV